MTVKFTRCMWWCTTIRAPTPTHSISASPLSLLTCVSPASNEPVYMCAARACAMHSALLSAGKILRELRKLFGEQNCKLIQLNSLAATAPDLGQKDIWVPHLNPSRGLSNCAPLSPLSLSLFVCFAALLSSAFVCLIIVLQGEGKADAKSKPDSVSSPTAASAAASASASAFSVTPAAAPVAPAQIRGCFLSKPDLDRLSSVLGDFILTGILPHLEKKIAALQEKVRCCCCKQT
jgi:hypothetical protein